MPRRPKPDLSLTRPTPATPRFRDVVRAVVVILAAFAGICCAIGVGVKIVLAIALH
jgi:hypothetical protein